MSKDVATSLTRKILLWEGNIYNRESICSQLSNSTKDNCQLAQLALEKWGTEAHHHLHGSFLLIGQIDGCLYLARGVYDSPGIFYCLIAGELSYSKDPITLAKQLETKVRIKKSNICHQLAYLSNLGDESPFYDIHSLRAGGAIRCCRRFGLKELTPNRPNHKSVLVTQQEWREKLLSCVKEVSEQGSNHLGLLLSGGIDSGALAAIATHHQLQLQTFTFKLINHPEEDESDYATKLANQLGLNHHSIEVQSQCFDDVHSFPISSHRPSLNPYQRMINEGYEYASECGVKDLWLGSFGDDILPPRRNIIRDLWHHNKSHRIPDTILRTLIHRRYPNHAIRTFINHLISRKSRPLRAPNYMRDHGNVTFTEPELARQSDYDFHKSMIYDHDNLYGLGLEQCFTEQYGIRRIHPWMHPTLIQLGLSTPSYLAHSPQHQKHIIRQALVGLLPDSTRWRTRVGVLTNYFVDGWMANRDDINQILFDTSAIWPNFVKSDAVDSTNKIHSNRDLMLSVQCLALDLWIAKLESEGLCVQIE